MKLGVYMGSFNPPHKGHIKVVNYLLDKNIVDKVLIVPTINYWDKNNLIDINDRINMLKFYENDNILVDNEDNNYCYTIDLVYVLKEKYPNDELYLIIGADNIIEFHKWKNYQELLNNKIIVMNRDNIDVLPYVEKLGKDNFIIINDFPYIDISSTKLRNNLDSKYLDKKVLSYIKKNNLYKE